MFFVDHQVIVDLASNKSLFKNVLKHSTRLLDQRHHLTEAINAELTTIIKLSHLSVNIARNQAVPTRAVRAEIKKNSCRNTLLKSEFGWEISSNDD